MPTIELRPYSIPAVTPDGQQFWLAVLLTADEADYMSRIPQMLAMPQHMCTLVDMQPVADQVVAGLERDRHVAAGGPVQ